MNIFHSKQKGVVPLLTIGVVIILAVFGVILVKTVGKKIVEKTTDILNLAPSQSGTQPQGQAQQSSTTQEEIPISSGTEVTPVKLTTDKHDGNFAGLKGMNEWIQTHGCPGYHVCNTEDVMDYKPTVKEKEEFKALGTGWVTTPTSVQDKDYWFKECDYNCGNWGVYVDVNNKNNYTAKDGHKYDLSGGIVDWVADTSWDPGLQEGWDNGLVMCFVLPYSVWCCK
jgi:hypothetical protein